MVTETVSSAIRRWNIPLSVEEFEVHNTIAWVLRKEGIWFAQEVQLSKSERLDFLCEGGIAIEVKTAGGVAALVDQLQRYAAYPNVNGIVLVTSRKNHRLDVTEIGGKPFEVIWICGDL